MRPINIIDWSQKEFHRSVIPLAEWNVVKKINAVTRQWSLAGSFATCELDSDAKL